MKTPQEKLAILNIWSRKVTTSTRETTTRAWIYDVGMAQFVLKIEKLSHIMGPRASQDLRSPSPIMAPGCTYLVTRVIKPLLKLNISFLKHCVTDIKKIHMFCAFHSYSFPLKSNKHLLKIYAEFSNWMFSARPLLHLRHRVTKVIHETTVYKRINEKNNSYAKLRILNCLR